MSDNTITIIGNTTRDPEIRFTPSGRGVANFGVAVNRRYQQNGEWHEQTSFIEVVAWGSLGENAAQSFAKGDRIIVTGRMEQREWETPEGDKRSKLELIATDLGASVKWATTQIEKTARAATSAADGADQAPSYDEEPF